MNTQEELVIKITPRMEIFVEEHTNGVISFKQVDSNVFLDCVKDSIKHEIISSGVLPGNCISFASGSAGERYMVLEFTEANADIVYEKTVYPDFPLPRLIFGFHISETGKVIGVRLGVADRGRITPETKLFTYPFSNVSGFQLCTGNNTFPVIKSLHQLAGLPYFILSMPNNNDRYDTSKTKTDMELRTLLEHLKDKDTNYYYSNVLIESGKTMADFIQPGREV